MKHCSFRGWLAADQCMSQMAMTISLTIIILMLLLVGILAQHPIQGSGHARALRLLKQWLSREQLACYERFAYFNDLQR